MDKQVIKLVNRQFSERDASQVLNELRRISLDDGIGGSGDNLRNTHMAILKLAKGDLDQVCNYVESARKDFRDVIYWASED